MKQTFRRLITPIFYVLLVVFFLLYLRSLDLSKLDLGAVNLGYLLLAGVFTLTFRLLGSYIWVTILRGLGARDIRLSGELLYVYAKSWLARYIPGTAPWILSKIFFASQHGISKQKLAVSSILEAGLQVLSLFALALFVLAIDQRSTQFSGSAKPVMWLSLAAMVVVLYPRVFNGVLSLAYRVIRRTRLPKEHYVTLPVVSKGVFLYLIGAIVNGLGLFFVAKSIYGPLPYDQLLFVIGSGTLASALGMVAVFAPSGIGVRDGIQLALLGLVIPAEYALLIVIATRVWDVVIDFVFYGVGHLSRFLERRAAP